MRDKTEHAVIHAVVKSSTTGHQCDVQAEGPKAELFFAAVCLLTNLVDRGLISRMLLHRIPDVVERMCREVPCQVSETGGGLNEV